MNKLLCDVPKQTKCVTLLLPHHQGPGHTNDAGVFLLLCDCKVSPQCQRALNYIKAADVI